MNLNTDPNLTTIEILTDRLRITLTKSGVDYIKQNMNGDSFTGLRAKDGRSNADVLDHLMSHHWSENLKRLTKEQIEDLHLQSDLFAIGLYKNGQEKPVLYFYEDDDYQDELDTLISRGNIALSAVYPKGTPIFA